MLIRGLGHSARRETALLLAQCLAIGASVAAAGQLPKTPQTTPERPIVFLAEDDSPPFSYQEDGIVKGKIVDLSVALGEALGRKAQLELADSNVAQEMILRGQGDGLFMPVSDQRRKVYDFADTIFTIQYGIFVRQGDERVRDITDLAGKNVGVMQTGYSRQYFSSYPKVHLAIIKNYEDGFHRLASGDIDAVATSTWLGSYAVQQHHWGNFVIAGPPFASVAESIAIKKGNAELLRQLNRAIATIKSNGTISGIDARWRPQQMLFVSRRRAEQYALIITGIFLALAFAGMGLWVITLKRHIRLRRKAEEHALMVISALREASDCITISDTCDRLIYVNAAFLRLYEYEEREILGTQASALAGEHHDPAKTAEILEATKHGGWRGELWNVSKTGRAFPISLATAPVRDRAGNVVGFVGVSRDITDERRAQETLRASEEKFSLAFKQNPSPVVLSRLADRRFVDVNDSFLEFYGAKKEEVIGKTGLELGLWPLGEERTRVVRLLETEGRTRREEVTLRTKRGEPRRVLISGDVLDVGLEKWLLITGEDVTAERQAREALRQSELKYRDLFENANDAILTTTIDGRITSMNKKAEQLFGLAEQKARSLTAPMLFSDTGAAEYGLSVARLQRREQAQTFAVELKRVSNGSPIVLEIDLRLIFENGIAIGIQAVGRDTTERRQLETQLRQAQKMEALGALAGGIAHDFNNLLTVIKGYSVLANDTAQSDEKLSEALREIGAAADRGAGLTTQLLAFSRQQVSRKAYIAADQAISGMQKLLGRILGEDVQLIVKLGASRAIIYCDPTQFDQVLLNLAVNARDAMPHGGKLELSSEIAVWPTDGLSRLPLKPGEYAVIEASDTGCGMDATTLSRVFEPFFTTKPAGKGTGLGLSTVYGIMKQNGGHVIGTSEVGQGSTFKLYFPISKPSSELRVSEAVRKNSAGSETVLLVEDDKALRQLSANVLEDMGYRVICAASTEEAERHLYEFGGDIHLLVTDVVMPGGSGELLVDTVNRLRPTTGILFVSGYTDGKIPEKFLVGSHPAFLAKPFTPVQLAEKVREMLDTIRN